MTVVRAFLMRHRPFACWLIGAALLIKALIPAGFMPDLSNGMLAIQICTGQGAQTVLMEIPGKSDEHDHEDHKKAEMPCAFSGLSMLSLAAIDPILLATAIAFILATAFRIPPRRILRRRVYLRPPPQGPPALA